MNRKMLTLILAVVIIAGFFLPFTNAGSTSAFDLVQGPSFGSDAESMIQKYGWLLIPVSGLALIIGALNKEQYAPARVLWALLPLLFIAYMIVRPITQGADVSNIVKAFGIGSWVMIGGALILAIYHPKRA
jgi:hypothetical protein